LYIYDKWDWSKTNPVIHLDFGELAYKTIDELERSLNSFLDDLAKNNEIKITESTPIAVKFAQSIEELHKKTDEQVVILVDEYDKPITDNFVNKEVLSSNKRILHDFYQVIKASDAHLKFVFMTGVSKFSGLSVFSALNNLNDITMDYNHASICGYTQEELECNFKDYIESVSKMMGIPVNEIIGQIKHGITDIHGMEEHQYTIHFLHCYSLIKKSLITTGFEQERQHFYLN
jgi:hypothetical protein